MTFLRVPLALAPSDVCNPHTSQFAVPICKCLPANQNLSDTHGTVCLWYVFVPVFWCPCGTRLHIHTKQCHNKQLRHSQSGVMHEVIVRRLVVPYRSTISPIAPVDEPNLADVGWGKIGVCNAGGCWLLCRCDISICPGSALPRSAHLLCNQNRLASAVAPPLRSLAVGIRHSTGKPSCTEAKLSSEVVSLPAPCRLRIGLFEGASLTYDKRIQNSMKSILVTPQLLA